MSSVQFEEERPWRCPACGYEVRGVMVGSRCSECGEAIDQRSFRPRWMRREFARGVRLSAAAGLAGNALPGVAVIGASLVLGLAGVGASGEWFAAIAFVAGVGAPFVQFVATLGLSKQAFEARRAMRIRRCAWIRPAGILLGGAVFLAAIRWGEDDLPWLFLMVAAVVIPGVGSDLALGRTVAELGRESIRRNHESGLSKSVSVTIAAVQVLGGLLLFVPFAGWVVGPLIWSMGNAAMFGRLALAAGRLERER